MSIISNLTNRAFNSNAAKKLTEPFAAGAAAATIALASTTSKDAVNCYYYVTQSLKNEKIPEEKRKFVASLDLSNGILNIITQLALGAPVAAKIDKFFDNKLAKKYFDENKTIQALRSTVDDDIFETCMKMQKSTAKAGLGIAVTLVVTQILAKRVIVPFLATPMASVIKKKMEAKAAQAGTTPPANTTADSATKTTNSKTPDCFKSFQ